MEGRAESGERIGAAHLLAVTHLLSTPARWWQTLRFLWNSRRHLDQLTSLLIYLHDLQAEHAARAGSHGYAGNDLAEALELSGKDRVVLRTVAVLRGAGTPVDATTPNSPSAGEQETGVDTDGHLDSVEHFVRVHLCLRALETDPGWLPGEAPVEAHIVRVLEKLTQGVSPAEMEGRLPPGLSAALRRVTERIQ